MKKKSIILTILTVLVMILTIYITTREISSSSFKLGSTTNLGYGYPGTQIKNATNVINKEGYNYFCVHYGNPFIGGGYSYDQAIPFKHIAKVTITGDKAKVETEKGSDTYTEKGTYANRAVALLFNKINANSTKITKLKFKTGSKAGIIPKQSGDRWNLPDYTVEIVTGETVSLARTRNVNNTSKNYDFCYDFGQVAMWMTLINWKDDVGTKMKAGNWDAMAESIGSEQITLSDSFSKKDIAVARIEAFEYGEQLCSDVYDSVQDFGNNQYGIEETLYQTSDKELNNNVYTSSYVVLGPFKYKFVGTIKNEKPTLTLDNGKDSKKYDIGTYTGGTFKTTNKIISENEFYIKVDKSLLKGVSSINLNFQIEGMSLLNTTTNLYFYTRDNNKGKYQPIVYLTQTAGGHSAFKDTYKISKPVDVSLTKLDNSGVALKAEGIKFQIKDNTNAVVAHMKTDANGNAIVTDSNGNPTGNTKVTLMTNQTYTLIESENNVYGYKKNYLSASNIEISGAEVSQDGNNIKFTLNNDCKDNVTIKAKNVKDLASLEIAKTGEENIKLGKVGFIVKIDSDKYLQLKDQNDNVVVTTEGTTTINSNNIANNKEYHVEYVSNKDNATRFVTDSNGKIVINNLEVNKTKTTKYTYTACEVYNLNYGYGSASNISLTGNTQLTINQTNKIELSNTQVLGNLELKKHDQDNHNVILPNVGFAIQISSKVTNKYAYLALYNENGEIVQSIKDVVTINKQNKANKTEYKVEYYLTDKASYKDLTDAEKANITTFITGDDATLTINNLEVYSTETTAKHKYKFIEVSNPNYGYVVSYQETDNLEIEKNKTTKSELGNKLIYTKISGYVWIENTAGKTNEYDNVYTNKSSDQKLTDLYVIKDGKLVKNSNAVTPVEIKLRNKVTGEILKALPDEFDNTGKYTFVDVLVAELENYEVVFVYDGFYYTTVEEKTNVDNGSKVKEDLEKRQDLNNKFASVEDNAQVISKEGEINELEYHKDGHTSTITKLKFDTTISANTTNAGYSLKENHNTIKENSKVTMGTLQNINMGIVLREQPKISINSDIYSSLIDFEGYKYNYKYNGRQNYYENVNGDAIGVKFEQQYAVQRYTRTVYASDIQAALDFNKEIQLSITYKIQIANQSETLSVLPKQIINYFDARYQIEAVGVSLDETTKKAEKTLAYSTPKAVQGLEGYNSTVIEFNQLIEKEQNIKELYITFSVNREAILDLLNQKSTYHNASEIISYASYYGKATIDAGDKLYSQNERVLYAGIDKMSQPGNLELKLINHPSEQGTQILDTTNFEDDSTSAPSLLLEAAESRRVSGTIWEDVATINNKNEKLGDGIFSEGEKAIQGVKVTLHKVNPDGTVGDIATYSNGNQVVTTSDDKGNYIFGYYDEQAKKQVGILPGKYVIKYTYNNETYIVGHRNINLDDYKSTIITSDLVKKAFEENNNQRWYLTREANRYSDARDNLALRKEYRNTDSNFAITNSSYNQTIALQNMDAYTPVMDIGIEFTEYDEADALTLEFVRESKFLDLGIVERPTVDIRIEKEITGLEIVAQNGTSIIPFGNPFDTNSRMQYVKYLDDLVSVEIETDLLQGAELKLQYTIKVTNNSNVDYAEPEYYYYGTGGRTEITTRARKVVDYLTSGMTVDLEKTPGIWEKVTAEELYNEGNGFVSEEVYRLLKTGNYNILTTNAFEKVGAGSSSEEKLYATKYLAVSDLTREENKVEIIEILGTRTIKDEIPGNYRPTDSATKDSDRIDLVITPPTGNTVNYMIYIIAAIATFGILITGIVIIKKKLIK